MSDEKKRYRIVLDEDDITTIITSSNHHYDVLGTVIDELRHHGAGNSVNELVQLRRKVRDTTHKLLDGERIDDADA